MFAFKFWIVICIIIITGCGAAHRAESQAPIVLSDDVKIRRLTDHVWLHTTYIEHEKFGLAAANGIVIVDSDEACLIDLPWNDKQTGILFDWIYNELNTKVRKVVPTHSHSDCAGGLKEAHRRGAVSYAYVKTLGFLKESGNGVPHNSFSDQTIIRCGEKEVILAYRGGGHTVDNIVAWISSDRVLFGGCLIKPMEATGSGNISEADLVAWPTTVKTIKDEFSHVNIVVPGHGSPGGPELIDHTIDIFER